MINNDFKKNIKAAAEKISSEKISSEERKNYDIQNKICVVVSYVPATICACAAVKITNSRTAESVKLNNSYRYNNICDYAIALINKAYNVLPESQAYNEKTSEFYLFYTF